MFDPVNFIIKEVDIGGTTKEPNLMNMVYKYYLMQYESDDAYEMTERYFVALTKSYNVDGVNK